MKRFLALIILGLYASSARAQADSGGFAMVNVYRTPHGSWLGTHKVVISIDHMPLAQFSDNTCLVVKVPAGSHLLTAAGDATSYKIFQKPLGRVEDWAAGGTYFYRFEDYTEGNAFRSSIHWDLKPVEMKDAAADMGKGGCVFAPERAAASP